MPALRACSENESSMGMVDHPTPGRHGMPRCDTREHLVRVQGSAPVEPLPAASKVAAVGLDDRGAAGRIRQRVSFLEKARPTIKRPQARRQRRAQRRWRAHFEMVVLEVVVAGIDPLLAPVPAGVGVQRSRQLERPSAAGLPASRTAPDFSAGRQRTAKRGVAFALAVVVAVAVRLRPRGPHAGGALQRSCRGCRCAGREAGFFVRPRKCLPPPRKAVRADLLPHNALAVSPLRAAADGWCARRSCPSPKTALGCLRAGHLALSFRGTLFY